MAKPHTHITEIDYLYNQYYSKYIAPIILQGYKSFKAKEKAELDKYYKKNKDESSFLRELADAMGSGGVASLPTNNNLDRAKAEAYLSGKWYKKNIEEVIEDIKVKLVKDKNISKDWKKLNDAYNKNLLNMLGKEGYVAKSYQLTGRRGDYMSLGNSYGAKRLQSLIEDTISRQGLCSKSAGYFMNEAKSSSFILSILSLNNYSPISKKALAEARKNGHQEVTFTNVAGSIGNAFFDETADDRLTERSKELHSPSYLAKYSARGFGIGVDILSFGGPVGAGLATKGINYVTRKTFPVAAKYLGYAAATGGELGLVSLGKPETKLSEKEFSSLLYGSEDAIKQSQKYSNKYRKNGTEYLSEINSTLSNKVKVKPLSVASKMFQEASQMQKTARGNSRYILNVIDKTFSRECIAYNGNAKIPSWMLNRTAKENRAFATSFYSIAREMAVKKETERFINGHKYTLKEVAQRAHDYAKAAVKIEELWATKKTASICSIGKKLIADFKVLGINLQLTDPPRWMLKKTIAQNRDYSDNFEKLAKRMVNEHSKVIKIGNKVFTLEQVAKRAINYAAAAFLQEQELKAIKQRNTAERVAHKHTSEHKAESSHEQTTNKGTTVSNNPYSSQTAYSTQQPTIPAAMPLQSEGGYKMQMPEGTSGWERNIDALKLNGIGDIHKNLGYSLAMLPDMLIGMFTGKTENMKLGDNLLPLAMVFGGMFFKKNPLMRMMMLGLGGAALLNNAGKAVLGSNQQTAQDIKKLYKQYGDEVLNTRISKPAMKGNTLVANIDGKPLVIKISNQAVDAYEKGALPLNTLANAVLKRYDEQQALLVSQYAGQASKLENEQQQNIGIK